MVDGLALAAPGRVGGVVGWLRIAPARPAGDTCSGARSGSRGRLLALRLGRRRRRCSEVPEDVLERVMAEHRALEPGGTDLDPEKVEEVVRTDGGDLADRLALDLVSEEAGAGLRDRAAAAGEPDPVHDPVLHAEHEGDPIATQWIGTLVRRVGVLDDPEVVRPPVVLEDVVAVEIVHGSFECSASV